MGISAGEKRTLNNAINRLPEAVAKQTTKLLNAFLNAGDLAQPLTTAVAAARHGTGPFHWRLTLNDGPPLTKLGQVLPKPLEGNYIVDKSLADMRGEGLRQGFESLPDMLVPCLSAWSATWMDPSFAGGGYELVPPSPGKRINANVHITYVQPHWLGVPNSDDISVAHQMVAFNSGGGYLLAVSIVPGPRGAFFPEEVPPADMAAALNAAYKLASSKANRMLGARLNRG